MSSVLKYRVKASFLDVGHARVPLIVAFNIVMRIFFWCGVGAPGQGLIQSDEEIKTKCMRFIE